ncbi:MAG: amidase, partial [SAR202 cluster bacterium]|nr:amidase [SAR202 cluster bacterium]
FEQAEAADRLLRAGHDLGPLHGVPISIKDIFATKGLPTTAGSKILAEWVSSKDATVVRKLRQAGAVLVGKTNLHEFAFGVTTENAHFGATKNPWNIERVPGGSSGGSGAAIAARMGYASLGSDTGGSIRIPAALCGAVGLKPTYGRVSKNGVVPLAWSLDHVGPLTRTVEDAAIVLNTIAGYDPKDPTSSRRQVPDYTLRLDDPVIGLAVGVPSAPFWEPVEADVAKAVREALEVLKSLGARLIEVDFPYADQVSGLQTAVILSEAAAYHMRWMRERPQDYAPAIVTRLRQGAVIPAVDYLNAQRGRAILRDAVRDLLRRVDVLATPTVPIVAPKMGQTVMSVGAVEVQATRVLTRNVSPFNLLGLPALSVPCGFDGQGLPIGLQIAGRPFEEETVLRVGHAYQKATKWHARTPSMAKR